MWNWEQDGAQDAYADALASGSPVAPMLRSFHQFLGGCPMMAYLAMMAVRLIEMHRILTPSGSLFLHCDPTASPYLRILLDAVFGPERFTNELFGAAPHPKD
jgi:site-specific DNA-methyltransferase (adenine-specific)